MGNNVHRTGADSGPEQGAVAGPAPARMTEVRPGAGTGTGTASPKPKRKRIGEFIGIQAAARDLELRVPTLKEWVTKGQVPGARTNAKGTKIPKTWLAGIRNGSIPSPDGLDHRGPPPDAAPEAEPEVAEPDLEPDGEEEPEREGETMPQSKNQGLLDNLRSLYGADSNVRVEISKRGPAGYGYQMDVASPPSKADLQRMFPEGGDFSLRVFKNGKVVDESSGILIDSADGTPYNPDGVPFRPGIAPRPRFAGPLPGRPPGLADAGPGAAPSAADHLVRRAADVAFEQLSQGRRGDGDSAVVLQTVLNTQKAQQDAVTRQLDAERQARKEEAERADRLRREEKEEAEARRKEMKEELEDSIAGQREEFEEKHQVEMEKWEKQLEATREREREFYARQKEIEAERSSNMMKQQQDYFAQLRELDNKRESAMEKARMESKDMQERMLQVQQTVIDEQRRANERNFQMQMEHFKEMKQASETAQPLGLLASALDKGLEKLGPAIQARMAGNLPDQGQTPASAPAPGQPTGGMDMNLVRKIKGQPFFVDELKEAAAKVKANVSPAFTVNKLMGMLQMDPSVAIVLDYVVTRDVVEVIEGVPVDAETRKLLSSDEGKAWWTKFRRLLADTMNMMAEQHLQGGQEQGPADPSGLPEPGLNEGHV